MSETKRTLVEEGTEFQGSMTSTCPIVVKGKIQGEVKAPSLSVSPSGAVHGKASVGEVISEGELAGEFDADSVRLSGKVKDNTIIRAKTLEVRLSQDDKRMQVMFGECELAVGDKPVDANRRPAPVDGLASPSVGALTGGSNAISPPLLASVIDTPKG